MQIKYCDRKTERVKIASGSCKFLGQDLSSSLKTTSARRLIRAYNDRICHKATFHFERLFYSPINKSTFSITDGSPVLNNVAHVTLADIEAENGVVHVITHILIPSSLASVVG